MKRLEDELKNALRRIDPPEDFTARTLLKINNESQRTRFSFFPAWSLHWAFAAVAFLLLVVGLSAQQHRAREEQRRGEEAKEQLMLALRIAGGKLQIVQAKVQQMNWNYQEDERGD